MNYGDYLNLDKILDAQHPESEKRGAPAHDEMLFIIIHQAYELWFRQILHEVDFAISTMKKPALQDNSPELQMVVHRLDRVGTILRVLVHQIDIMETMTPMDFLDFRDMLRPASGFQSLQFKEIEAKLGLKFEHRHGTSYYTSQLSEASLEALKQAGQQPSLLQLVNEWLGRMPFFTESENWVSYQPVAPGGNAHVFWADYRNIYAAGLAEGEQNNLSYLDQVLFEDEAAPGRSLSPAACRAALFIMLYRGYPILQLPFQLLNNLLDIDEQMSTWRYRHMNMVHRMIGTRTGTGGSTGKNYLESALSKHTIYKELAQLTSFLIERRKLPALSAEMERRLGFAV